MHEGDWQPRRIVLLEFPSLAAWESFYNGETYRGLKSIRDGCSSARLVSVRTRLTMAPKRNQQVRLKSRPSGIPQAEHFEIVEADVPELAVGQILVRNEYLSVEPAMRGWVSAAANYSTPVAIGDVMRAFSAGTVVASRHPGYREGDAVMGMLGWQHYALSDGRSITRKVKEPDLPLSLSLGVLGLNGITAYFGLLDLGQPRPGDTVVVSTAAGAVGSAVGQIAKLMGCRTVGIAGGAVKTQTLPRGIRLRCRHRLQVRQSQGRIGGCLPARRRRLFRQHGRRHQRCGAGAARDRCTRGDLRHRLDCELGSAADGSARRAACPGQARAHQRPAHLRLRAPL